MNRPLWAYLVRFNSGDFNVATFDRLGLVRPDGLARWTRRRQSEFLAGRSAARVALMATFGQSPDVPIGPMREPVWPGGVVGSITHGSTLAAAVVAPLTHVSGIGIDVEQVIGTDALAAVAAMVVNDDERAFLASSAPGLAESVLLTIVFSAKESLFKAVFHVVQRWFEFDAARTISFDAMAATITFELTEQLAPELPLGTRLSASWSMLDPVTIFTSLVW